VCYDAILQQIALNINYKFICAPSLQGQGSADRLATDAMNGATFSGLRRRVGLF
jgi:hypothetical protein